MDNQRKKQLREQYKQRKIVGGVFQVRNTENGKYYMLSTDDIQASKNSFERGIKMGGALYPPMQEDHKRYGNGVYVFEILEELEKREEQTRQEFQKELKLLLELCREQADQEKSYIRWDMDSRCRNPQ